MDELTVGDVAKLTRVSVRTLHHYDEVGLLTPSGRSDSGYRLYSTQDLQRLRQIRFYRELEFGLAEIAEILGDADAAAEDHLRRQHRLLRERRDRDEALLTAIENEMEARRMGISLTPEEQFEVFGTDHIEEHYAEAEQRWGDTDSWRESQRRTAAYTKEDWLEIKAQTDENVRAFAAAIHAGEPAGGEPAMALAEDHRQQISRWFYDCGYAMHRGIAELYVSDERYGAEWEKLAPGFSRYVHDAIQANADRAEGGS